MEPQKDVEIAPEVKPTIRAFMAENLTILLSALIALSPLLVDREYMYYWYAGLAALIVVIAAMKKWKVLLFLLPPTVTAMVLYYFIGKLAALSVLISAAEFLIFYDYVKSTSYRFMTDGVVIKVRSLFEEKTERIPIDAIVSISVESGFLEKVLGHADIHIELRSRKKIHIVGVPKDVADKVSKVLLNEIKVKREGEEKSSK